MTSIADVCIAVAPVSPETPGDAMYARFKADPDLLSVAVVDDAERPIGLVERHAFFLKFGAEYGRALYAKRPIGMVMDRSPTVVDAETQTSEFTGAALAGKASELLCGFIVVQDGRYLGVGNVLSLLQSAVDENARRARELTALAVTLTEAEEAAQSAHRRVREAIEAMPEGVAIFDAEDRYVLWNRRYAEIQSECAELLEPGLPFRAVLERGLAIGAYADALGREDEWLESRLARARNPINVEEQALPGERWVRVRETRVDDGGRISVAVDITELKAREKALRRTQAFLDTVVDSMPAMLFVKEPVEGRYVLVNRAAEERLGKTREELLGKRDHDLYTQEEADFFVACDREVWASGAAKVIEEEPLTTPAGRRWLKTEKRILPAVSGESGNLLVVAEDITERKQQAEALQAAVVAAQAADTAKSAFLANMSHEIRTPLNGVLGLASVLAAAPLAPEHKSVAATIAASATTLERLLSDVLDLARMESGAMEIRPEPTDLNALVDRCAALFRARAAEKALPFSCHVTERASGRFLLDPVRVEQILNNLLSNAVKFTTSGHVALIVDLEAGPGERPGHRFDVVDTGIGFDAAGHAVLFERFSQADGSITRRFGGTGLGLAIARDLAQRMGGALTAASRPGVGSVFTLRAPLEAAALDEPEWEEDEGIDLAGRVVLVADDHPVNRDVVRLILESVGAVPVLTEDGAQALARFELERFDAALIDMQMPVMDGLTAIRAMRAHERATGAERTPILALTANAMPEHRAASAAAGADGHLAKPIVADRLLAAISTALTPGERPRLAA